MIATDDPRHGTNAGYCAGCREDCCRAAIADFARNRRARIYLGGPLTVPSLGTRRRIQALMALGWGGPAIDARLGKKRTYVSAILGGGDREIHRSTAEAIAKVYDEMSMTLPPQNTSHERQRATRARNYARRMGWAPPLAWDDIDNDVRPSFGRRERGGIDEAVVIRALNGEQVKTTKAEKDEIARRWRAMGRRVNELERLFGWKADRYGRTA